MRANRMSVAALVALGFGGGFSRGAYGQTRLEFDVASVKPAPPPSDNRIRISMDGGPGTPDPGRLNYEFVNLRMVLAKAYAVKSYQISGPATLDSERFNMTAKVPPGTTKEQFNVMLQNLVADRFKMTLHREKKDLPAYALVVAKGGVKMKLSAEEEPVKEGEPQAKPPVNFGKMPMGKDGFPVMPKGAGRGGMAMIMMPGRARFSGNAMTITRLCESLEQQLDRAVVDQTELTDKYDFTLTFEPEPNRMMGGLPPEMMKGGGGGGGAIAIAGGGGENPHQNAEQEAAPNIFTAVQEQLGLKLEPRKTPVDLLVIDHLDKAPIEN